MIRRFKDALGRSGGDEAVAWRDMKGTSPAKKKTPKKKVQKATPKKSAVVPRDNPKENSTPPEGGVGGDVGAVKEEPFPGAKKQYSIFSWVSAAASKVIGNDSELQDRSINAPKKKEVDTKAKKAEAIKAKGAKKILKGKKPSRIVGNAKAAEVDEDEDIADVSEVEEEAIAPSAKNSKAKGTKRKNVLSDTDDNHIVCGELASVKEQAIGRIFRQGQTSEVTVTRIILRGPDGERCLDDWTIERNADESVLQAATSNFD